LKGEKMCFRYRLASDKHAWWKAYIRRVHHEQLVAVWNCPGEKDETTSESETLLLIDTRVLRERRRENGWKGRKGSSRLRDSPYVCSFSLFLPRLSRARDASNDGNRTTIQIASNSRRE